MTGRKGSLRCLLGAVAGVFLFLQVGLIVRNGCEDEFIAPNHDVEEKLRAADHVLAEVRMARQKAVEKTADADIDRQSALMFGVPKQTKAFMTVGVPSIQRSNVTYLEDTISSLSKHASSDERKEIIVVVFLSDFDENYRKARAERLKEKFFQEIDEGFLHVIKAPKSFYPNLNFLERTFNDPEKRVKWRSKQNYDYAFLMKYSQSLAHYYMQLEDDVVTVEGYLTHVKNFIARRKKKHWSCLEFSQLGFIGKLFPSEDIGRLAKFLITFFDQQPVDLLLPYFYRIMTQNKPIISKPSLFQHMGARSSFGGGKNPLKDRYFALSVKTHKGDNPAADIYSSMETFEEYAIERAYKVDDALGFFWGKTPKVGDNIRIVFNTPQILDRIVVVTGSTEHPGDKLKSGVIEVGQTARKDVTSDVVCPDLSKVGTFKDGIANLKDLHGTVPFKVSCIQIRVDSVQNTWLIVSEIAVFVKR